MPTEDMTSETAGMEARLKELIAQKNQLKVELAESKATVQELQEAAIAAKAEGEGAVTAAGSSGAARIAELEGQLRKSEYKAMLSADKVDPADMDDMMDYLDYQFSKVTPEAGAEKPAFADWYGEARKSNKVLRAAMRKSVLGKIDGEPEPVEEVKGKPKPSGPVVAPKLPPKAAAKEVPPVTGATGRELQGGGLAIGSPEFKAMKAKLQGMRT